MLDTPTYYGDDSGIYRAFCDGYIFVEKTEVGEGVKVAIYNSSLERIVDFSEDVAELYEEFKCEKYYGGFLYSEDFRAFDLKLGALAKGFADTVKGSRQYPSDFWYYFRGGFYDSLGNEREAVLDISEYESILYTPEEPKFIGGEAYLLLKSDGVYSFAVMLEGGELAFDPVELRGQVTDVQRQGDKYLVYTEGESGSSLYSFNRMGSVAELQIPEDTVISYLLGNDAVMVFDEVSGKCTYYDLHFRELITK